MKQKRSKNVIKLSALEQKRDSDSRASCRKFVQYLPCFKLNQSITRCRECRNYKPASRANNTANRANNSASSVINSINNSENNSASYCADNHFTGKHINKENCCFFYFRHLQYNADGNLVVAGFPNPFSEPTFKDCAIWKPDGKVPPTDGCMDLQASRFILLHLGDQFCHLWSQEADALKLHTNPNSKIAWRKTVNQVREICDVCETSLFNYHWTCKECAFCVCIDCFKERKEGLQRNRTEEEVEADEEGETQTDCDEYRWPLCKENKMEQHKLEVLILTQIIANNSLNDLGRLIHEMCVIWEVPQICDCLLSKQQVQNKDLQHLIHKMILESRLEQHTSSSQATAERLQRLEQHELARQQGIDYVPERLSTRETLGYDPITNAYDDFKHINFVAEGLAGPRRFLPPRTMTLTHSTQMAPGVPHEWLCDGKLLRLTDPKHHDNRLLFQSVWRCGQPVIISHVESLLNLDLWRPESFLHDLGKDSTDLVNCLNGSVLANQPMRVFWEGFQSMHKRMRDGNGNPVLLKLKDWPPDDDFALVLPTRFADLMRGLPMPEYTLRTGSLNIANSLPQIFVHPDLGPKMYSAYGSSLNPTKGTTNLHLDISDAVNILVYVGIPTDKNKLPQLAAAEQAIALGGCDYMTRARCQLPGALPGALWHIFSARDTDKIRALLNSVTLEKGGCLEVGHDPIHDQSWYLDEKLRGRLHIEYGVESYPIVQCLGDAIFIPAGAPHQVQNLHNCLKVAHDFVSPENITHCYHLMQEFRLLSPTHSNHEDKLQVKNMIYHALKDCCNTLDILLKERIRQEKKKNAKSPN